MIFKKAKLPVRRAGHSGILRQTFSIDTQLPLSYTSFICRAGEPMPTRLASPAISLSYIYWVYQKGRSELISSIKQSQNNDKLNNLLAPHSIGETR